MIDNEEDDQPLRIESRPINFINHARDEEETILSASADPQIVNYTKTIKNKQIFQGNSESVNIAILALSILDFIMWQPKNRNDYPMSKSKSFLLQKSNIAVMLQLLLLENTELTRCVMKFIYFHLRSDYALEMIKSSGIVEFAILLLDNSEKTNFNSFEDDDSDFDEKD